MFSVYYIIISIQMKFRLQIIELMINLAYEFGTLQLLMSLNMLGSVQIAPNVYVNVLLLINFIGENG